MPQFDLLVDASAEKDAAAAIHLLKAHPLSRMGEKAPDALRTISEVAAELGEETHVLRFWETRFSALRPIKMKGARRYYRPEDVALLRVIRSLLHEQGYTIKGAQAVLAAQKHTELPHAADAEKARIPLSARRATRPDEKSRVPLENALAELREMRSILHSFRRA